MSKFYDLSVKFILFIVVILSVSACGSDAAETPAVAPTESPQATAITAPTASPVTVATPTSTQNTASQPKVNDILVILTQATGLERFAALLENAGLTDRLQGAGPFTVFVPPTVAWDELPPAILADPELMREILLNHIVEGDARMTDLGKTGKATNLRGDELTVLVGEEGATIQGSNVLVADFEANNGVLHVIDTVILPQEIAAEVMALYPAVVGEQTYPMQGNIHIAHSATSPVAYNSIPPTSGPHYSDIVAWQVYEEPFRYEQLVHNLEDGGVMLYYQCEAACPERIEQLRTIAQPYIDAGRHVAVVPNEPTWILADESTPHQDMSTPIAVVAWRKLLKLDEFDTEKIRQFIEAYEGIDHHVK